MILSSEEAAKIYGGDGGIGLFAGVGAAIAFLISLVDGFLNPSKCG